MATTDILPFATAGGANVESQASYAADPTTAAGYGSGILPSQKLNKVLRQSAFMAAGLANWMVGLGINVPDDGNLSTLVSNITAAIAASSTGKYFTGGTTTGSANAQVLTPVSPSGFTFVAGNLVAFTAGFTNTGATTLTINGTGVKNLFVDTPSGPVALSGGEVIAGNSHLAYSDGTRYILIDPATFAFLNSPTFTGIPSAPTAAPGTNTTQLATCAFMQAALAAINKGVVANAQFSGLSGGATVFSNNLTVTRTGASTYSAAFGTGQPDTKYHPDMHIERGAAPNFITYTVTSKTTSGFTFNTYDAYTNNPQESADITISVLRH